MQVKVPIISVCPPEGGPITESMGKKAWRRRSLTPSEFKAEIVRPCHRGDRSGVRSQRIRLDRNRVAEMMKRAQRDIGIRQDGGSET